MDKFLCDLEFYLEEKNGWIKGEIIGIYGEKSFIMASPFIQRNEIIPIENIRKITKITYDEEFENSFCKISDKFIYDVYLKFFFLDNFVNKGFFLNINKKKLPFCSFISTSE